MNHDNYFDRWGCSACDGWDDDVCPCPCHQIGLTGEDMAPMIDAGTWSINPFSNVLVEDADVLALASLAYANSVLGCD